MKNKTELSQAVDFIKSHHVVKSRIAIILGSGLGSFADDFDQELRISTKDIPYYPKSTVDGHAGQLVFGYIRSNPVIALQGRTHFYEGYSLDRVAFIVNILSALGVSILIITNAAGGVNPRFKPGDLMQIKDHINFSFKSPLRGIGDPDNSIFVDMSNPYSMKYFELIQKVAINNNINLQSGTLFASTGPSYETSAEVRMAHRLGADAASMSTVPEVIVANQCGMEVIGISCITNMATGISRKPLNHAEVTSTAGKVKSQFINLARGIIEELNPST